MIPVKLAFLVGISDYGGNGNDLEFCVKDVIRLAEVLKRKGFQCSTWIDKQLPDIIEPLGLPKFLASAIHETDTVVFYFSGHGEDLGGEQILLGKGVQRNDMQSALYQGNLLSLSCVLDVMAQTSAQKIVIIDACRVPTPDQKPAADLYKGRAQTMGSLDNCAVVFASADGKESFGTPDNKHSRFTHVLTEELKHYGRGFLSIFEAAVKGVSQYNDGKRQTPWVYASLYERMFDGFKIAESKMEGIHFPRHLCGGLAHGVWATLVGSNALATYQADAWIPKARIPEFLLSGLISFDRRADQADFIFIREKRKTLEIATISYSKPWQTSIVHTQPISTQKMKCYFGAHWSPSGDRLLAFGVPAASQPGVVLWNFPATGNRKIENIEGLPVNVECNAAVWVDDSQVIVSLFREDLGCTHIYCIVFNGVRWTASPPLATSHSIRISAVTINENQQIFYGCDDGSVGYFEDQKLVVIERKHDFSGRNCYSRVPWTGPNSKSENMSQLGVCRLIYDLATGLLGISYFDGTAAFLDPILRTYVKHLTLKGRPIRPGIALVGPSKFVSEGETGHVIEIVIN